MAVWRLVSRCMSDTKDCKTAQLYHQLTRLQRSMHCCTAGVQCLYIRWTTAFALHVQHALYYAPGLIKQFKGDDITLCSQEKQLG